MLYEELFERNYGVFTEEEQARIRDARVVIVGCGGIGGATAITLARSGLGHFVLYELIPTALQHEPPDRLLQRYAWHE